MSVLQLFQEAFFHCEWLASHKEYHDMVFLELPIIGNMGLLLNATQHFWWGTLPRKRYYRACFQTWDGTTPKQALTKHLASRGTSSPKDASWFPQKESHSSALHPHPIFNYLVSFEGGCFPLLIPPKNSTSVVQVTHPSTNSLSHW